MTIKTTPSSMPSCCIVYLFCATMAEGPTVVLTPNHQGLNLAIGRLADKEFEVDDVPEQWRKYYPNLAKEETISSINQMFHCVGYLFMYSSKTKASISRGTAFQIAPSIIVTSMHIVETTKKLMEECGDTSETVLYYTTQRSDLCGMNNLLTLGTNSPTEAMFVRLVKEGTAIPVARFYEEDVGVKTVPVQDPLLNKQRVIATRPDFCLLELAQPLNQKKYFIPHPKARVSFFVCY